MKKVLLAVALASLMGAAQAARSPVALVEPARVVLASATSTAAQTPTMEQVKSAIIKGGVVHDWMLASDEPGKLRLKFNKQDKHEVVVDVSYDPSGFQIRYVSSVNMQYATSGAGAIIHPFYNKWIGSLSQSILLELGRAPVQQ
ncbi:hypothetical protein [Roseateles oligotrophus]|uniref:Lipoprotein n=1 Tax=Roseateles oligotrophus TaxID=1769250 RepID=A0ABT2YDG1_9BURK|nr:hypothetical protein [Roseateles oligotrophus]MCV2368084.1 hypothetical protein [Roseateles oligotrophus]